MDVISLSGYTEDEKFGIAKRYLVPKQLDGLDLGGILVLGQGVSAGWVRAYTREAGVRNLERRARRRVAEGGARQIAEEGRAKKLAASTSGACVPGSAHIATKARCASAPPSRVWPPDSRSAVGGDVLFFEATGYSGKGRLTMGGQARRRDPQSRHRRRCRGCARTPSTWASTRPGSRRTTSTCTFPAGGGPEDGPSAGGTMARGSASLVRAPVSEDVGMTGEITLHRPGAPDRRYSREVARRAACRPQANHRSARGRAGGRATPRDKERSSSLCLVDTEFDEVFEAAFDSTGKRQAEASVPGQPLKGREQPVRRARMSPPRSDGRATSTRSFRVGQRRTIDERLAVTQVTRPRLMASPAARDRFGGPICHGCLLLLGQRVGGVVWLRETPPRQAGGNARTSGNRVTDTS